MLERWTRAVVSARWLVVGCWVVVASLGALGGSRLPSLLTTSLEVPSTSSATANALLARHFAENVEGTFTVVVRVPDATRSVQSRVRHQLLGAVAAVPTAHVVVVQGSAGVVFATVGTTLDLRHAAAETQALRAALRRAGLGGALVTGPPALQHDVSSVLDADLRVGEAVAVLLALLLLLFALGRSWLVLVPLAVAGATVSVSLGAIYLLAHRVLMVLYVPNVVELIGLGLAIDYSLLMVHRFREESRDPARPRADAVVATTVTAGRTVALSAVAVALGLSALLLVPVPFVRSLGAAGLVVPIVSLVAALSLQPALLSVLPGAAHRVRSAPRASPELGERTWARIAGLVLSRPREVLAGSLLVLVACATPALWLQLTPGSTSSIPASLESARGIAMLSARVGPGVATPTEIVIDAGRAGAARSPAYDAATLRLAQDILDNAEVFAVAIGPSAPYVDPTARFRRVYVVGRHQFGDPATQALERALPRYVSAARFPSGAAVAIGGAPAQGVDFLDRVYGAFPYVVVLVLALAFVFLLLVFRSVLLAALAVVLDVCSLAAAYGVLVAAFRFGAGHALLGLSRAPQIEGWVPVLLFALLFGLSMDYQVFLVLRMRESRDGGADTPAAIRAGLVHTGRVVSTAAAIFVAALLGLIGGRVAGLQELGVGLAVGVLIDATVVRGLLLPSSMTLIGDRVWSLRGASGSPRAAAPPPGSGAGPRDAVSGVATEPR